MKILMYDFEVFKHNWLVVTIDYKTKERTVIIDDQEALIQHYANHSDDIWVGYNSRQYDQYIMKGIILGKNPYEVSNKLIVEDMKGYQIIPNQNDIHLNNFDIATGFHSLKQLEGFMGSKIKESDVPFNIQRPLTKEELDEVILYCTHDVEETIKVFDVRKEEFDSQMSLIEAFDLPMEMFNKTKAQLSAYILGANNRPERNDEFDLIFPDTLVLSDKYKFVLDWYKTKSNMDYNAKLCTDIANVPHIFAWGGIHGAIANYNDEGLFIMSDIASMYPALMIEYDCLSRNVENPSKYREIRDERLRLKKLKDPRQAPMKIVLNGTFGASKDKYNNLYDPRNANIVCVSGQLLLLDLIDKVEPYCELVQSNTDGILVKVNSEEDKQRYLEECDKWSKRTRLDLEHDEYVKVVQKDVNNYIIVDASGKYKTKGAYVKKLSKIDYDLPIINKALIDYFTKGVPLSDTITNCNDLIEFQKIVNISRLYQYAIQGDNIIKEKILRVFASTDKNDKPVYKVKTADRFEKISYTPEQCFIYNESVIDVKVPDKLDKQYYIDMAEKRLQDFLSKDKKEQKPKSEIKGVNAIIKSQVEEFLQNDESDSILEFIKSIKESTTINKSQFEAMAKLNYFTAYAKTKKLLKCYEIYENIYSRKQFKIKDMDKFEFTNDEIEKCANVKTETTYKDVDMDKLLNMIYNRIEDEGYSLKERLGFELNYYGKLKFTHSKFPSTVYYIQEMQIYDKPSKPYFKLYSLKNGEITSAKITNEDLYMEAPIKVGHIIKAVLVEKPKYRYTDGKRILMESKDNILTEYEVY